MLPSHVSQQEYVCLQEKKEFEKTELEILVMFMDEECSLQRTMEILEEGDRLNQDSTPGGNTCNNNGETGHIARNCRTQQHSGGRVYNGISMLIWIF